MTNIKPILIAVLAFVAAMSSSCSKEYDAQQIQNNNEEERGQISVSVKGLLGDFAQDEGSKSTMVNTVRVKWVEGDKVYAYDAANKLGELTVSLKPGNNSFAVLNGTIKAPTVGNKIFLVHSNKFTGAPAISGGKITFDLSSQTSADGGYTNAPFIAYGTMAYNDKNEIVDQVVDFTFASSIMRLNCTGLKPGEAVKSATLAGFSNQCVINLSGGSAVVENGQNGNIKLTISDALDASANGAVALYASIAKNEAKTSQVLLVEQNNIHAVWNFGSKNRGAAQSINAVCQMTGVIPFPIGDGKKLIFAPSNIFCTRTGSEGNWTYTFAFEANPWDYRTFNNGKYNGKCVINGEEMDTPLNTSGLFQWISNTCSAIGADEARRSFGAFSTLDRDQANEGVSSDDVVDFGKVFGEDSPWRALTYDELLSYIQYQYSFKDATVHSVQGAILFPKGYEGPIENLTYIPEGCVFFPNIGHRNHEEVNMAAGFFPSWASTNIGSGIQAGYLNQFFGYLADASATDRYYGLPVRLVMEIE